MGFGILFCAVDHFLMLYVALVAGGGGDSSHFCLLVHLQMHCISTPPYILTIEN